MLKLRPVSLAALALFSGIAGSSLAQEARRTYIVQLQDQPVASYVGGIKSLAATQTRAGGRIDFQAPEVQQYVQYLGQRQSLVTSTLAESAIIARYDTVLNGFAALLTDAEVIALQSNPHVLSVQADEAYTLQTISTTEFLGLSAANGLWTKLGGNTVGSKAGEGIVVGIVDGGIWPESPAFADRVDANGVPTHDASGTQVFGAAPAAWTGSCVAGSGFDPAKHCNNKLIGARFFNAGFKSAGLPDHWSEFQDSPRDSSAGTDAVGKTTGHGGHGSHTASTAAGNYGATAIVNGVPLGIASGMAPRARIASYKVCWTFTNAAATDGTGSQNTCYGSDSVAAIDQAVKDGVNVINFSISGGTSVNDAVEQAFLRAANAGVFVAASAGNSGPGNQVAHISPWLTTVAASTHDRVLKGSVTLADAGNSKFYGASFNTVDVPASSLVRGEDVGLGGGNANLCFSDAAAAAAQGQVLLDPAKVAGKVVICTRAVNARVDKSLAVRNAGGIGMVLADNGAGLVSEAHSVPTVHVSAADGATIKSYAVAAAADAKAAVGKFANVKGPAPIMAGFSSRGPNRYDGGQLKPDLTAPGVDVIANVSEAADPAKKAAIAAGTAAGVPTWASYQGTSMSSPHVAGLAALLKQLNPSWTPAMIKSALMTTATTTLGNGLSGMEEGTLPWGQGAGHVNPNGAADPGLVYNLGKNDYIKYQCKVNKAAVVPASDCTTIGTLDETYNLNLPSLTVENVLGSATLTRTVTNVGNAAATYTASSNLPGFTVAVTPASFTLAPGASKTFTVKLTAAGAQDGVWAYGDLSWKDGAGHVVRSPLTAKVGKAISAPADQASDRASGSKLFAVKTGFSGKMGALKGGLKDVTMSDRVTLVPEELDDKGLIAACKAGVDTASVKVHKFSVPANTTVARFALRNADTSLPGKSDFDMAVVKSDGSAAVYSGNAASTEAVQLASPTAGEYHACVLAYGSGDAAASDMSYRLSSWVVTTSDSGGKFTVALPAKVVSGGSAIVGMSWSGLEAGKRYLGAAQFLDAAGKVQATTVLRVEPGMAVPQAQAERVVTKLNK